MIAQVLAVLIFVVMFALIISEKIERHIVTLVCGLATLVFVFGLCMHSMSSIWDTLNVRSIFTVGFWYQAGEAVESSSGINWSTIIFILGMMIMVEGMARVGFFRWLCMKIAQLVHYRTIPIFITFMIIFAASVFLISLEGNDLVTNFTAVAATINNIGPGLELVGPMENFGFLPALSKYVLMFDMLAGRLELFPLLILFHPAIWKDTFKQKIEMRKRKDRLS